MQLPLSLSVTEHLEAGDWARGSKGERNRRVLLSWLGVDGGTPTLEELGARHDITRERARQIKNAALGASVEEWDWVSEIESGIRMVRKGRVLPATLTLIPDLLPWIGAIADRRAFWRRFVRDLAPELHLVPSSFGEAIAPRPPEIRERAIEIVGESVMSDPSLSITEQRLRIKVRAACLSVGLPEFEDDVLGEVRRRLVVIPRGANESDLGKRGAILGMNLSKRSTIQRILRASRTPLSVQDASDLAEIALGEPQSEAAIRDGLAKDGHAFGRSIWGLPKHLRLTPTEQALVAEACESIVEEWREHQEQWHASDLLLLLGEVDGLPDISSLDHYKLSVILHAESDLEWLGRSVWAHPDQGVDRREISSLLEAVLQEADGPLSRKEIRRRISRIRGLNNQSILQETDEVARVGRGMWGLLSRDFTILQRGLGPQVLDDLVRALSTSGSGLHPDEITEAVIPSLKTIPVEDVRYEIVGLARRDDRLWVSHGGMIGLSEWKSMRRMSVHDGLTKVASTITGPTDIADLASEVSSLVAREIHHSRLYNYMSDAGLEYDADGGGWRPISSD